MRLRQYDKKMEVFAVTEPEDTSAGFSRKPVPIAGGYPCHITDLSGTERLIYAREGLEVSHRLWCPVRDGQDGILTLTAAHWIQIDNTDYSVGMVRERGGRTKHYQAELLEIRRGDDSEMVR